MKGDRDALAFVGRVGITRRESGCVIAEALCVVIAPRVLLRVCKHTSSVHVIGYDQQAGEEVVLASCLDGLAPPIHHQPLP